MYKNKLKNINKIFFLVLLIILSVILPIRVFADEGAKPSITVKIKNLNTTNYIVDLFVYDEKDAYNSEMNYNGDGLTKEDIKKLYDLNYDGWISESTRWSKYLLFADCAGNSKYENNFGYFGTPNKYKIVIINNDTEDIKISNEITRKDFNSTVTIDYNTMEVDYSKTEITKNKDTAKTIYNIIIAIIVTVIIELLVAFILKVKNYGLIIATNIITNLGLQLLLIILTNNFICALILGEIIVFICELLVYLTGFKNTTKNKIILYTLLANAITLVLTFYLK